jgi:hypothetical protein
MSAAPKEYDLTALTIEDANVEPWDWNLSSSVNDKVHYKFMSKEPLEYFDFKQRYLVKQ